MRIIKYLLYGAVVYVANRVGRAQGWYDGATEVMDANDIQSHSHDFKFMPGGITIVKEDQNTK